jgi:sugar/nucleoside kinase (ribokinase family)
MHVPTVLLCGHVTLDRVGELFVPGGSAYYSGQAWRALGARVRVLTAAASGYPPDALAGLEVHLIPAPATTVFVNVHHPDGSRTQRVEAQAPPLDPARLDPRWRGADVLHLAPVLGELDVAAFRASAGARLVGLAAQGLVRAVQPDGSVAQPRWEFDPRALAGVDAVCLGEDDVRGQGDLVERLTRTVPVVAFTHGAGGAEIIVRGRTHHIGVYPVDEVDPVGAGDVFASAFLFGLARGDDPVSAARLGAAAGSIAVEARGGEALPRVGEAFARAARVL